MQAKPLIQHFETYLPFEVEEKQLIHERISFRKVKRREHLLRTVEICRHYTFVVKGVLRMYGIDGNGKEHNILFASENEWLSDISSFHATQPGESNIQALEPTEVIQIEQQDLYYLYINIPKLDRIFKVITEEKYVELQNRVFQSISSTAQERYLYFLSKYPSLGSRLPNTQIASYLGITPEFLSMIRKELVAKK
ncbi:Crp/Fnr family transcriptional regulator [Flagellimonas zhangzhouensis]|uniref:cAMP-binding domain of CRP or a regulatory subunit of cAMP-dependent protein kinases n=1 Tax=Flagellimonas zhangzhouensis TaxID=1073328 RepID=A0A1H2XR71_9FLAO|nr:Crp/Fnr family transcriptional regulator [Allomuricauda zhangzhouensis]SDQ90618.1 cAMP-binding domain of CRP or a regulatory subunit of cAMP-dependent protein kinases [Allomuricauda zhangzhouensis]SDW95391.1 cAMP-binding domain of CRP or a regulatory subunit of cAMP-dependent protein kinases [Allomuricauda zhangzhouensis]